MSKPTDTQICEANITGYCETHKQEWNKCHPADTNQASEDELERKIEQCFIKNNMCDCGDEHTSLSLDETEFFDVEAVVKDIKQLIRTEKLKLLAEAKKRRSTTFLAPTHGVSIADLEELEAEL